MLHVLFNTILPIFSIIFLGYLLNHKGVIDAPFAKTANLIVFNVAIPAMLLNEIAQAPFHDNFNLSAVFCIIGALVIVMLFGLAASRLLAVPEARRGTFLQSSFHGNLGYMAYAIGYYALGESHLARMAILGSFLMVGQNLLAVWALTSFREGERAEDGKLALLKHALQNPIILSVITGIVYSAMGFGVPAPIKKGLDILSGMAFPTALLLIGASLSFGAIRALLKELVTVGALKLVCLPFVGYALMLLSGTPEALVLPGMILLGSPPATVTYVMATELGGDPELAATCVSVFTLASAFSYSLILSTFA